MFTGIVEEIGQVTCIKKGRDSARMTFKAEKILSDIEIGHSISVNGICLTVIAFDHSSFSVDVMHESLKRTNLGDLNVASSVNLERAMPANGRFDGHIVSGHIDGRGKISQIEDDDNARWFTIQTTSSLLQYIVEKGSITVDGISLTVAWVNDLAFAVSIIPHTLDQTILSKRRIDDTVNLEVDVIGKYVHKLLGKEVS